MATPIEGGDDETPLDEKRQTLKQFLPRFKPALVSSLGETRIIRFRLDKTLSRTPITGLASRRRIQRTRSPRYRLAITESLTPGTYSRASP
jgi:hypothetical protein